MKARIKQPQTYDLICREDVMAEASLVIWKDWGGWLRGVWQCLVFSKCSQFSAGMSYRQAFFAHCWLRRVSEGGCDYYPNFKMRQ